MKQQQPKHTRNAIWRHNGHVGSVRMMQSQLRGIIANADTVTDEARLLARALLTGTDLLIVALATRKPPRPRYTPPAEPLEVPF